jgi:hypothetical protein
MISHISLGFSVVTVLQQKLSNRNMAPSGGLIEGGMPILSCKDVTPKRDLGFCERLAYLQY